MTIHARCRLISDRLLKLSNDGKKFIKSQEFSTEYADWLRKIQTFYDEEVDDETDYLFSLEGVCFSNMCGDIDDVIEFCNKSIENKTIEYCRNIVDILDFYIPIFRGGKQ